MSKLLICDDDKGIRRTLQLHLESQGHEVETSADASSGISLAQDYQPDVIILDICMQGLSGIEALPRFKQVSPTSRIIMITAFQDMQSTISAMQNGADEYLHKPIDLDEFDQAINTALAQHLAQLNQDKLETLSVPDNFGNSMVGSSNAMKQVYKTIGKIAHTRASVLITGESGTGKEMVARAIHQAGMSEGAPFVALNCAALVDNLLESELFGHKRGAFTGAVSDQAGKFALAQGGTLFLDEVGELSAQIQAKLLRVLQEKTYTPLGSKTEYQADVRIISATNLNFDQAIKEKRFREDLYYRLQVVQIELPSLLERKEDLKELVPALLYRANRELGTKISKITKSAMDQLTDYHWPGNVRELENTLIKAVALCPSELLTEDLFVDIEQKLRQKREHKQDDTLSEDTYQAHPDTQDSSLQQIEYTHVKQVLSQVNNHKGKACEILQISRPRLQRILEREE